MQRMLKPLQGLKVLELAGLAPVPMVGLMLRDFGAEVVRVDRFSAPFPDVLASNKRSICLDLRNTAAITAPSGDDTTLGNDKTAATSIFSQLVQRSDVLLDPFRPGTLDGLGFSTARLHNLNAKLVIARVTGYGGESYNTEMTHAAGHDINYLAMSGLLSLMCRGGERPQPPLNILADFAGGSSIAVNGFGAAGIMAALLERERMKVGSVVDVSITAGSAYLASLIYNLNAKQLWRMTPFLRPGGAPYYDTYATRDNTSTYHNNNNSSTTHHSTAQASRQRRYLAIGAIEPQFYALFVEGCASVCDAELASRLRSIQQHDAARSTELHDIIAEIIASRTQEEWMATFGPTGPFADACVTPVLSLEEGAAFLATGKAALSTTPTHQESEASGGAEAVKARARPLVSPGAAPHLIAREGTAPASSAAHANPTADCIVEPGTHTNEILTELGYSHDMIQKLVAAKVVKQARPGKPSA